VTAELPSRKTSTLMAACRSLSTESVPVAAASSGSSLSDCSAPHMRVARGRRPGDSPSAAGRCVRVAAGRRCNSLRVPIASSTPSSVSERGHGHHVV
jgi:hypothetical protein